MAKKKQTTVNGYFFHSDANLLIVVANGDNPFGLTKHLKKEIEANGVSVPTYMAANSYIELPMGDKKLGIFAWDNTDVGLSFSTLNYFIDKKAEKNQQIALLFPGEDDKDINTDCLPSFKTVTSIVDEIYLADHPLWQEEEVVETH